MLSLDTGVNPLKVMGSTKFLPQIEVMLDRRKKEYPPTMKKLSIEVNIPEYLVKMAADKDTREAQKAIVDLTLIAFYYLLCEWGGIYANENEMMRNRGFNSD